MNYKSIILAATLIPTLVFGREIPTAKVLSEQSYNSEQEAAIAALQVAIPLTDKYEVGGVIVLFRDKYYYTVPVSSNQQKTITFHVKPTDGMPVALYHTHPSLARMVNEEEPLFFSAYDVDLAEKNKINSYLGIVADKTIRVYLPGKTPKTNNGIKKVISPGFVISKVE